MRLIKRFLLAVVWRRAGLVLLAGIGLFSVFDLMKASETLWGADGGPIRNIFIYLALRLPTLAAFLTPLAVLVGAIGAFSALTRRNEIVAMQVSGLHLGAMTGWALAAAAPFIVLHAVLTFTLAPKADYALSTWMTERGIEPPEDIRPGGGISFTSGGFYIEAQTQSPNGADLWSPVIIMLAPTGEIRSVATGSRARVSEGDGTVSWSLENAHLTTFPADGAPVAEAHGNMLLPNMPRRAVVRNAQRPVEHLPLGALVRLAAAETRGATAPRDLRAHAVRRAAAIATSFLMLLIAAPVAFAHNRTGEMPIRVFTAVALAFAFIVIDRTLFSLGLAGHLPPIIAGAGASVIAIPLALLGVRRAEKQL